VLIVVIALPHIGMALTYESGAPERYLPALPAVFLGFGYAIGSADFGRWARILTAVLCCAHIPVNLASQFAATANAGFRNDASRVSALKSAREGSRAYVVSGFDGIFGLKYGAPFHPINRQPLPVVATITPLAPRVPFWRRDFACGALSVWDGGGEVWVTRRVFSERPARAWLWVEGDDRRWTWAAIYKFFQNLGVGEIRGGDDGFSLLENTMENRRFLLANITDGSQQSCTVSGAAALADPAGTRKR
jgi:hypothetical protein